VLLEKRRSAGNYHKKGHYVGHKASYHDVPLADMVIFRGYALFEHRGVHIKIHPRRYRRSYDADKIENIFLIILNGGNEKAVPYVIPIRLRVKSRQDV